MTRGAARVRRDRRERRAGFTLTEMMIVMAIVGVMVALAYPMLKARPRAIDVCEQVAGRLAEASRQAIAGGAVRPNVVTNLGLTARTRVIVEVATDLRAVVATERLEEELPVTSDDASWIELKRQVLPRQLRVAGYSDTASLTSAGGPAVTMTGGQTKDIYCQPDGRCGGVTLYLQTTDARSRCRVVVLPLGGAPVTFPAW